MTELKKQIVAVMLTHICRKDRPEAACPFHVLDPSGTELCPAGMADNPFTSVCLKMTKEKWLKWMEQDDEEASTKTVFAYPPAKTKTN